MRLPKPMRQWLNDDKELTAFVQVSPATSYARTKEGKATEYLIGADLTIADCKRQIYLDFGCYSDNKKKFEAQRRAALKKLRVLQEALSYVEAALNEADFVESYKHDDYL